MGSIGQKSAARRVASARKVKKLTGKPKKLSEEIEKLTEESKKLTEQIEKLTEESPKAV
jgi:cell division protein FtsB